MKSYMRETQKHGFRIDLAPELALVMLFLLKSLTSTQIQAKGNAGNVAMWKLWENSLEKE